MRLIDADAIAYTMMYKESWLKGEGREAPAVWKETIDEMPTIDAVPVIRCKDCKWYGRADKRRFYRGMDCLQNRIDTIVPDRDYCSRAERRNDGIQK